MTREELVAFARGVAPESASVRRALIELIRLAGPSGSVDRYLWSRAIREGLRRDGVMVTDSPLEAMERLRSAGIVGFEPEGPSWDVARVEAGLWRDTVQGREEVLLAIEPIPAPVPPEPGPDATPRPDEAPPTKPMFGESPPAEAAAPTTTESTAAPPSPHSPQAATPAPESAPTRPAGQGSVLRGQGLTKSYRKRKVVDSVDIEVGQGEIVGLLGPNGAGKTTSFYMMVGLIAPDAGKIFLDGKQVTRLPMYKRARMGVGYLAQEPSVFRKLTVEENVLAILETLGLKRAERRKRLDELLSELSIAHLRKNKAYSLSGGERRRLEITRALVQRPRFMLLDEPFAGIDPIAVSDIQEIVASLKTRGIGVMISDHNVEQTLEIVDRAYIMYEGRIRVSGSVSELVWNDDVAEIYLGPTLTARMRKRFPPPEQFAGASRVDAEA